MQDPIDTDRTWQSTMALLSTGSETQLPTLCNRACPTGNDSYFRKCAIRVLERNDATSVTVAWSDATSCCYGEQLWRRCVAKKAGICALSGQNIARGNAIYRPKRVQPVPRNVEAMILATVVEVISAEQIA